MERNETTARRLRVALRASAAAAFCVLAALAATADGEITPDAIISSAVNVVVEAEEQQEEQQLGAQPNAKKAPGPLIGIDDATGWGSATAHNLLAAHVIWNRVEIGAPPPDTVAESIKDGFKVLAIAGNTEDGAPLSKVEPAKWGSQVVSQLKANPGATLAEAGNEMYLKGGVAEPVQYGKMYLAAVEAMKKAGLKIPLLFNMWGDYLKGSKWSEDAHGGGWLRDAVNGVPGLAAAISANGLAIHNYGAVGENTHDSYGVAAAAADESVAKAVLGAIPPVYVTEFGYDLNRCGANLGACSEKEQAQKLRAAYRVLMGYPNVAGIWWYQARDDGTGHFGVIKNDGSLRPSFKSLSRMAKRAGQ